MISVMNSFFLLGIEHRASHILGKYSTTKLYPSAALNKLYKTKGNYQFFKYKIMAKSFLFSK